MKTQTLLPSQLRLEKTIRKRSSECVLAFCMLMSITGYASDGQPESKPGPDIPRELKEMPAYQFPCQPVTLENAKNWKWMQAFYEREVSRPASANETTEEVTVRAANVRPTREKLDYLEMEFISFPHFGMSTFSGRQQGSGKEDPRSFNPTSFDADEWVRFHKAIGAKMIVFVAKHHDGYALWPTKQNDYCIRSAPWRDGKGDMVKEIADACRRGGLKLGLYISLWDEHDPRSISRRRTPAEQMTDQQRRAYQEYVETQLLETIDGRYGEISELWFDGAGTNGAEDWNRIYEIIHHYQPTCLVSMCGFGIRWCGNESAIGSAVNWNVMPMTPEMRSQAWVPFHYSQLISRKLTAWSDHLRSLQGQELFFFPQEGDMRLLLGGWHWDRRGEPFSLEHLVTTWYDSIGSGAVWILSPAPDPTGVFNAAQLNRLLELRSWLEGSFGNNLLSNAKLTMTDGPKDYPPAKLLSEGRKFPCIAPAGSKNLEIEAEFPAPVTFNNLLVQEYLEAGQRISAFTLESFENGVWKQITRGRTVGHKRAIEFPETTAQKIRFRVTDSRDTPGLRHLGLYKALPYRQAKKLFTAAEYHEAIPEPAGLVPGLRWSFYEDANNGFLPYQELFSDLNTKKVSPDATGVDPNPMAAVVSVPESRGKKKHFAMRFDGYIKVPVQETYAFKLGADSGCRMYINGQMVIENDASVGKAISADVPLNAGLHRLTVLTYFGASGSPKLDMSIDWRRNAQGNLILRLLRHEPVKTGR